MTIVAEKRKSNQAMANKQTNMIQYHLHLEFIEPLIEELN
jgi:hypothetical protein